MYKIIEDRATDSSSAYSNLLSHLASSTHPFTLVLFPGLHSISALELQQLLRDKFSIDSQILPQKQSKPVQTPLKIPSCKKLIFGGTFDHLHTGHLSLLASAALFAQQSCEVTVGLTCEALLSKKRLKEFMQSFCYRKEFVKTILLALNKTLKVRVEGISDPIGPAGRQEYDLLILTKQSRQGGRMVNQSRTNRGLPPLDIFQTPLVQAGPLKISSSDLREQLSKRTGLSEHQFSFLRQQYQLGAQIYHQKAYFEQVVFKMSEPHRHYHTLRHLHQILSLAKNKRLDDKYLKLAAFLHDIVYDPKRKDNQQRSKQFYLRKFRPAGQDDLVSRVIIATKSHKSADPWISIFLDLDCSILAVEEDQYRKYLQEIRSQYSHLREEEFRNGRSAFVKEMLSKETIFGTYFQQLQAKARKNLTAQL